MGSGMRLMVLADDRLTVQRGGRGGAVAVQTRAARAAGGELKAEGKWDWNPGILVHRRRV